MLLKSRRVLLGLGVLVVTFVVGILFISAQQNDGRINQTALLGGAAIYCIDSTNQPAANYGGGGIRVLQAEGLPMGGEELLFVPDTRIDEVDIPEVNTILGEGTGPYGPMALYRITSGEFVLVGYEEPGKKFDFVWKGCGQVGNAVSAPTSAVTATLTGDPTPVTNTPTPTPTGDPAPDTATPTDTPTDGFTSTPTDTPTDIEPTFTFTPTDTPTDIEPTFTFTPTDTPTDIEPTFTFTPTNTVEPTFTFTPTDTIL